VGDELVAGAIVILCLATYGLAPDSIRERWWASWARRDR